ncbi:MAG TPA: hypothetical protein VIY29_23465 [Ktedonobacteraceae bacterium]
MDTVAAIEAQLAQDIAAASAPIEPAAAEEEARAMQQRIQQAIDATLEYHRTHRPVNTARNYAPKQKEWQVASPPHPPSSVL